MCVAFWGCRYAFSSFQVARLSSGRSAARMTPSDFDCLRGSQLRRRIPLELETFSRIQTNVTSRPAVPSVSIHYCGVAGFWPDFRSPESIAIIG
jgi:hypothetical protein